MKLTHLQERRLRQLWQMDRRAFEADGQFLTSHWSSSKSANEKLCELWLAERYGQTFWQPSGKVHNVGDVRITQRGRDYIATGGRL